MITANPMIASQMGSTEIESRIELPFPTLYFWVLNGDAKLKSVGGPAYYGGWATSMEMYLDYLADTSKELPKNFIEFSMSRKSDGGEYQIMMSRTLPFIKIAHRERWLFEDKTFKSHYMPGGRHHVQVLGIMGERNENSPITEWGAVVLSGKGYQANNLLKVTREWDEYTRAARAELAPGWPSNAFWMFTGTFGSERVVETVGSGSAKSPITPITFGKYDDVAKVIEKLWVGEELAKKVISMRQEASEWLNAWKDETPDIQTQPPDSIGVPPSGDNWPF